MNLIFLVIPILTLLMYELGLSLNVKDFKNIATSPKALIIGTIAQIIFLPLIAFIVAHLFKLPPIFYMGLILIACCPGGSSSNVFTKLCGGDVALSILLTCISSIITIFTIPIVLSIASIGQETITLPTGKLIIQNLVLMLIPILLGIYTTRLFPDTSKKIDKILSKISFPALMLLAAIFFIQHHRTIGENFGSIGGSVVTLLLLSIGLGALLAFIFRLKAKERKCIVIEVGMQNAAQAIAISSSPFIFNDTQMAIPAIIYALAMNIILLIYIAPSALK